MRNREITSPGKLLKANGTLAQPGWSRKMIQVYNRENIAAPKFRIKEWDYYIVMSKDFGFAFTISDNGYIGLESVSFLDFKNATEHTQTVLKPFTMGSLKLPRSSEAGNTVYEDKRLKMEFRVSRGERRILCDFLNFCDGKRLTANIKLSQPEMDSIVIATPFKEKKNAFYYNQKINCMPASGTVNFDGVDYEFNPETDFGTLDWGRGVWTYDNTWYWGSGNAVVNGKHFGFNIGYGFGDTSLASENVIFYDGKAHKIDDVIFNIPATSYTDKWTFTSSDGRFEMEFEPIIDRAAKIDLKVIITDQHQVFGKMSGKAILNDGTVLEIKDVVCFAEKVHNKY